MKKSIFVIITFSISLLSSSIKAFSQVNLAQGLIAYYPFNGNAIDASGNGNNASFNNASLTTDRFGNPNSAYYFNGIDNYIQIPNSISLNPAKISLCAIVKPMGFYYGPCHGNAILNKANDDYNIQSSYRIRFDDLLYTNGQNCFNANIDSLHQNFYADFGANSTLATYTPYIPYIVKDNWYCIVYTYDGGKASLYINGNLVSSQNTSTAFIANTNDLYLGHLNSAVFPYWFNGVIDEVRIYDRAITPQEVGAICTLCNPPQGSLAGDTICSGKTGMLTFNSTAGTPPFTIQYSDGPNKYIQANVTSGMPFTVLVNPTTTTTYILDSVADATGCSRSNSFTRDTTAIVINPLPQAYLTASDICSGDSTILLFTATSGTSPFNIGYSGNGNGYALIGVKNNSTFTIPYLLSDTTVFKLTSVTDANGCTAAPDTAATVNVASLPQGGLTGNAACAGDSAGITFNASSGVGPFEVEISDGTNTTVYYDVQSGVPFKIAPVITTTNISLVSIIDRDGTGCKRTTGFTSPVAAISVNPSPHVQFNALTAICIQQSPFLITQASETTGIAGSGSYSGVGVDAGGDFSPSNAGIGTHKIIYTYTATNGCFASDSSTIVVNPTPVVSAGPDIITCFGFPVQLNATGASVYVWSPVTGLDNPAIKNPVAAIDSTTNYIVQGTDSNGCYATDTINVTVGKSGVAIFVVPNAFTPNGDGVNDCFGIRRWGGVTVVEFSIFNRWGQVVFSTKNPSDCWDGTYKGVPQPTGGYPYIIKVKSACGDLTRTGTVMLVR